MKALTVREIFNPIFLCALLGALIFLAFGFFILSTGHLHEDAYILYIYAENLAEDGVVSYYRNGPHAEGATDFLWMILISILNRFGVDSAYAALALNGFGIFLIAYLSGETIYKLFGTKFVALLFSIMLPFTTIANASYAGFSTALYSSLVLLIFYLSYLGSDHELLYIPILSLLLGLFRPDGVIIGVTATVVSYYFCSPGQKRAFVKYALGAAFMGAVYFALRWDYFGDLLPLPLRVKSESDELFAGLGQNLQWASRQSILIFSAIFYFARWEKNRTRLALSSLPVLMLLVSMLFAVQSQNVSYRFQAPATVVLIFIFALVSACTYKFLSTESILRARIIIALYFVFSFGTHAHDFVKNHRYLTNQKYINFFPFHARSLLQEDTVIALTEAGRAAYWMPGKKYDLVGLNTAYTAKYGADPQYIESLNPDIIFLHVAGTIKYECNNSDFCAVSSEQFIDLIEKSDYRNYRNRKDRVTRAPLATYSYLADHINDYVYIFVRYKDFSHLWAIKRSADIKIEDFYAALSLSFDEKGRISYRAMKNLIRTDASEASAQ